MVSNKKILLWGVVLFFILINSVSIRAQQFKYVVYFTDKNNSPYSLNDPAQYLSQKAILRRAKQNIPVSIQDFPVNSDYVSSLKNTGVQLIGTSKWLNAALVLADASQISSIHNLSFVRGSNKVSRKGKSNSLSSVSEISLLKSTLSLDYGSSLNQVSMLGIDKMHNAGFHGEDILIAVIDAGFKNANTLSVFDSLFNFNRVEATYDFVDNEEDVYDDDSHGTKVLSLLAAYSPGSLIGGAWRSNYLLLRSENASSESVSEEINWVRAAEYADSAGADIINSSLGYNTFDDASMNHSYNDLDGNSTIITQAADIVSSKGILLVNSAGNEGAASWKYINAPADGDSVLAVGAVTPQKSYFYISSVGPSYDGRIKPDVAAQGNSVVVASMTGGTETGNGTSYASPLIAGLAAGIWQAFPELTNMDLLYFIKRSGSQYFNPDNKLGYGIPYFSTVENLILSHSEKIEIFPNIIDGNPIILNLPKSEVNKKIDLRITDVLGRVMAEEKIVSGEYRYELKTNMNTWSPGIYLLTVLTPDKKYSVKILKK